jgi:hypothetical protein
MADNEDGFDLSGLSICDVSEDSDVGLIRGDSLCLEQGISFSATFFEITNNCRADEHIMA